jgi:hypothetical protein
MTEFLLGIAIGLIIGFGIGFFALGIIIGIRERDDEPTD